MKLLARIGIALAVAVGSASTAVAHCEIPCGIYDDKARIGALLENADTVEKAMEKINELKGGDDHNQLVRWIVNKETHAGNIQYIVTQYFMTQRIKPPAPGDSAAKAKYTRRLELLHGMLVHAMKSKQTTDAKHVETLRVLIKDFDKAYFEKKADTRSQGKHESGSDSKKQGSDHK